MNLYEASCWYFDRSQSALRRSLGLGFVLLLLTLIALRPSTGIEDAILIVLIASLQLWQMWSRYRALYWFGKADEPRRMYQLEAGLGITPSAEKCARIEEETGKCDKPLDPAYWVSRKPRGATRMIEMLLESSYYTRSLARQCRNLFFCIGGVGLAITVVALIMSYRLRGPDKSNEFIAHVILTVLVFFLTGDFWIIGLLYNDLFRAANESHARAYQLLQGEITFLKALEAVMDYNTAVVQAPPLLSFKHLRSKDNLDELFRRNYGKLLGLDS